MEDLLRAEGMLEDLGRTGKGLVDVAAPELEIERDIGALAALEVLEVGERAGGLEFLMHQDLVLGSLDLVEDRRQLFVFGDDQLRRLLGDMGIGGKHHCNRLADIVHLVDRQDRLIVECRPVIGLRDNLAHVLRRDDAVDPGHLLGGAGIDRLDAAMGDGAAEDLSVQHAGKPHCMGIFGAPGDLLARLEPRRRTSDLTADARGDVAALHGGGCHQRLAPLLLRACSSTACSLRAWRTARPT